MAEFLEHLSLSDLTPAAVLTLVILMILWGKLVTPGQHNDMRADRDYWRDTAQDLLKANSELRQQVSDLTVSAEAGAHALTSIKAVAASREGGEGVGK